MGHAPQAPTNTAPRNGAELGNKPPGVLGRKRRRLYRERRLFLSLAQIESNQIRIGSQKNLAELRCERCAKEPHGSLAQWRGSQDSGKHCHSLLSQRAIGPGWPRPVPCCTQLANRPGPQTGARSQSQGIIPSPVALMKIPLRPIAGSAGREAGFGSWAMVGAVGDPEQATIVERASRAIANVYVRMVKFSLTQTYGRFGVKVQGNYP